MNFILVPFLLGIRLLNTNDVWEKGPEYTFGVRFSTITRMKQDDGELMGTSVLSKMKCRPKEQDALLCHFEDSKITRLSPKGYHPAETVPNENATYRPYGFGNGRRFEIKFGPKGVESYNFANDDKKMSHALMNAYRMIANQLSVGANVESTEHMFTDTSYLGKCNTSADISRENKTTEETESKNYELVPLTNLEIDDDTDLVAVKMKLAIGCIPNSTYFFPSRHTYGLVPVDSTDKLTYSASRMRVSKSGFSGESVNLLNIEDENGEKIGNVMDHIFVSLESVDPAKDDIKPLPGPIISGGVLLDSVKGY